VQETNEYCWIADRNFPRQQLDRIRAKLNPAQLVEMIYTVNGNLMKTQTNCYRRWLLNSAIRYNHTELITYLLPGNPDRILNRITSPFDILNASICCQTSLNQFILHYGALCYPTSLPLFVAMDTGDPVLVEALLHAGSAITRENGRHLHVVGVWSDSISAIEYALVLKRPKMLQLLVVHYQNHR